MSSASFQNFVQNNVFAKKFTTYLFFLHNSWKTVPAIARFSPSKTAPDGGQIVSSEPFSGKCLDKCRLLLIQ